MTAPTMPKRARRAHESVEPTWLRDAAAKDRYGDVEEWHESRSYADEWREADDLSQAEWADLAAEMAVPTALARVNHSLGTLPLPKSVTDALMSVISCAAAHAEADVVTENGLSNAQLLDAVAGARVLAGFGDSVVVEAAGSLAARAGAELLGRKGVSDPAELTASGRARWRAKTKSLVAAELSTLTGWGVQECHTRVGVALAPQAGVGAARSALAQGATDWRSVSAFWQKCRAMDVEDAGSVDLSTFGPYLEGYGDDGDASLSPRMDVARESWPSFHRRLCLEVTRVEGADEAAARARRRAAQDRRGVRGEMCDDGSSTFTITGSATSVVAALDRLETVARRARKAGDPRPLDHIRSDTALALLVHGTLPLSGRAKGVQTDREESDSTDSTDDDCGRKGKGGGGGKRGRSDGNHGVPPDDLVVPFTDEVQRIITGAPTASVDVIVPMSVIAGSGQLCPYDTHGVGGAAARASGVAEIPGYGFLAAGYAAEVIAAPGTLIHRLLTDPADGRLIERSTAAYRPDRTMIDQVRAADLFCRAPGCLVPAARCEVDHETPYGTPGGVTSETNLNLKHPRHHQFKTEKFWTTVMDETRNLTWTTLFRRVYRTRPHDYRQYDNAPKTLGPQESRGAKSDVSNGSTIEDTDLRDRLIYAALCDRNGRDNWLEAVDDSENHYDGDVDGPPLAVFHRAPHQRRRGAPVGQVKPQALLTPPAEGPPVASEPPPPF